MKILDVQAYNLWTNDFSFLFSFGNVSLSRCTADACGKNFYAADKLKRHVRYAHSEKRDYLKV